LERRRHPGVREVLEDLRARRGKPRLEAVPIGRVRRQCEHHREVPADLVGYPRRLLGVVDADVNVDARGRVAMLWILDVFELGAIAWFLGVFEFAPPGGGMETRPRDRIA